MKDPTSKNHPDAGIPGHDLQSIFNLSLDLICIADLKRTTFVRVNPALERLLGYRESELLDRSFMEFIHPDDINETKSVVENKLKQGEAVANFENRYRCKDGSYRWLSWTSHARPDLGLTYAVARDVTDHKRAHATIERRAKFEAIITRFSRNILRADNKELDEVIHSALRTIGLFCEADRAYVFLLETDGAHVSNTHEWCHTGVLPQIDNLQNIHLDDDLPWFSKQIRNLQLFLVESVYALPPEAEVEKQHFEDQDIQSLVVIPMVEKGKLMGFLGFDAVRAPRSWSPEDRNLLTITGEILAGAISRRRTEQAIEKAELMNRSLLEGAPVCNKIIDLDFKLRYMSTAGQEQLKIPDVEPYYGQPYPPSFFTEATQALLIKHLKFAMTGQTSAVEAETHDMEGNPVWYETTFVPALNEDGQVKFVIGTSVNITERKHAEEQLLAYQKQLKSLASELTLTEERLRRRVATELHDRISQALAMSKMNLASLQKSINDPSLQIKLTNIIESLKSTLEESQSLTNQLSYPVLHVLGLARAIEQWLKDEIGTKHGLQVQFSDGGFEEQLDEDIRAVLFRSVREILNNVVKHAQAQYVTVALECDDGNIVVVITDDGRGCDLQTMQTNRGGYGLLSIQESLERFGGRMTVDTRTGRGCQVTLKVPLVLDEKKAI